MLPITGYSDVLSAHAGESIAFKVSSQSASPYKASLVRVIHADPNPAGPGMKFEPLGHLFSLTCPSVAQPFQAGSFARVQGAPFPATQQGLTVGARIQPTALTSGEQCVLSHWDAAAGQGLQLLVSAEGVAVVFANAHGAATRLLCPATLRPIWYEVWFVIDPALGRLTAGVASVDRFGEHALFEQASTPIPAVHWPVGSADILIAALEEAAPAKHFNGKIEQPYVVCTTLACDRQAPTLEHADPRHVFAAWDFALGIDTLVVTDTGPHMLHGRLVNLPARAVCSSAWTGRDMCWRHRPDHYAAIHFHDDDLHDLDWATDFRFTVPTGLASGSYAMHLTVDGFEDWLPFYVTPALGRPTARIAFIAPTFTYQAYANYARGNFDEALRQRVADWKAYPHNPDEHREYGLSTYNLHSDGSGVAFSSRLRPMLTMRPGFITFNDARGSGCRHYIADSHLLDWLEHEGLGFDIVTDDDLHRHGSAVLAPYAAVLTGSHPEYHTERTLDALQGYLRGGGNLAYLGGNGFYWRVAVSDAVPGALEMRRAENGTRAWAAATGEYFYALDGNMGGLWRNSGRTPQQLVGIGFTSQGLFEGASFRINDSARSQPGGWLLEDVQDGLIGDYGLSGGGAAGFELDSTCKSDGTPDVFTLIARSEGHSANFGPALDALLSHTMNRDRGDPADLIRAEMIYFDTRYGGSVFSVGSITFCGSLSHNDYRNDISTLLRNYIRRMQEPSHSQQ